MKCFYIMVSEYFPKGHPKAGCPTDFIQKIQSGDKLHTIRLNYHYWKDRIDQINSGSAYLSLRHWSDKPYRSKQVEFKRLHKVGIERADRVLYMDWPRLAENDGLEFAHFLAWFNHSIPEYSAIIHFTDFRYFS